MTLAALSSEWHQVLLSSTSGGHPFFLLGGWKWAQKNFLPNYYIGRRNHAFELPMFVVEYSTTMAVNNHTISLSINLDETLSLKKPINFI